MPSSRAIDAVSHELAIVLSHEVRLELVVEKEKRIKKRRKRSMKRKEKQNKGDHPPGIQQSWLPQSGTLCHLRISSGGKGALSRGGTSKSHTRLCHPRATCSSSLHWGVASTPHWIRTSLCTTFRPRIGGILRQKGKKERKKKKSEEKHGGSLKWRWKRNETYAKGILPWSSWCTSAAHWMIRRCNHWHWSAIQ